MKLLAMVLLLAATAAAVEDARTDKRSFRGVRELVVDNINGPIDIVASASDVVELTALREARASSREELDRAEREVKLVAEQAGDKVKIYVDYPCDHGRRDYHVKYSYRLQIPSAVVLDARTVNGGITARYQANPRQAVKLETVNGSVDTTFMGGLAADVQSGTLNGNVYTDYEVSPLPARVSVDKVNGMTRYRSNGGAFRIGAGGPSLEFKTLNGNILIRSEQK